LEHLLSEIEQLGEISLDHKMPAAQGGRPGDMWGSACHTGENEYVLRWKYTDREQAAKFEEFKKSHALEGYL
jgi:hypothetical protein